MWAAVLHASFVMNFLSSLYVIALVVPIVYGHADDDVPSKLKARFARYLFSKDSDEPGMEYNVTVNVTQKVEPVSVARSAQLHSPYPDGLFLSNLSDVLSYDHNLNLLGSPIRLHSSGKEIRYNVPRLFEMTFWKGKLYLISCYSGDYCDIGESYGEVQNSHVQSILFTYQPKLLKFFTQENHLYMAVIGETSSIYKWMGSYFDETEIWQTPGTKHFDLFAIDDSIIVMVFAQNYRGNGMSDVFVRKNEKTKLVQRLPCVNAQFVAHYNLATRHGVQNYLLILSKSEESPIFWWNGKRFSFWNTIPNIGTPQSAFVGTFRSEPLLFISNKDLVAIYHAKTTELKLINSVKIDGRIVSFSANDPNLVFLLSKSSGARQIIVVQLQMHVVSKMESKNSISDCFGRLFDRVKQREALLLKLRDREQTLLSSTKATFLENLTVDGIVTSSNISIKTLNVDPVNINITTTPKELLKKLSSLEEKFNSLREAIDKNDPDKMSITVNGDLYVGRLEANELSIQKLNNRPFNIDSILSKTKNQHIENYLKITAAYIDRLDSALINRQSPNDLVQKTINVQNFDGDVKIKSLKAINLTFKNQATINGMQFQNLLTVRDHNVVRGLKHFKNLNVRSLKLQSLNNGSPRDWLPSGFVSNVTKTVDDLSANLQLLNNGPERDLVSSSFVPNVTKSVDNLSAKKLTVKFINNVPWSDFLNLLNEGSKPMDKFDGNSLKAIRINGIPVDSFLTANGSQNVTSKLTIPHATIDSLKFNTINNKTLEEAAEMFKKIMQVSMDHNNALIMNESVKIQGRMNISNIHFHSPTLLKNSTVDFNSMEAMGRSNEFLYQNGMEMPNNTDRVMKIKKAVFHDVRLRKNFQAAKINGQELDTIMDRVVLISKSNKLENVTFNHIYAEQVSENVTQSDTISINGNLGIKSLGIKCGVDSLKCFNIIPKMHIHGDVTGRLNNRDLKELSRSILSRSRNQNITGDFVLDTLNTNYLNVVGLINGVNFSNVLLTNTDKLQVIKSDLFFTDIGILGNVTTKFAKCDLSKVAYINLSESKNFELLEVVGEMSWNNSIPRMKSLSHLLLNAVSPNAEKQSVSGAVTIKGNMSVSDLSLKTINQVDFEFFANDAILSSAPSQSIIIKPAFKRNLTATIAEFKSVLSVDYVDGIDIITFNKSLVRKDDKRIVTGVKTFTKGFFAHNLTTDEVHGVDPSDLVFYDEYLETDGQPRFLPKTTFKSLQILTNLTTGSVNDLKLEALIANSIDTSVDNTFNASMHINGNVAIGSLNVKIVNGLEPNEVVGGHEKVVDGFLIFNENVEALNITVDRYNDINIKERYEMSIRKNKNTTIAGNLILQNNLTISGNIDLEMVNECNLSEMFNLVENYSPIVGDHNLTSLTESTVQKINEIVARKPLAIFKYLEVHSKIKVELKNVRSTSVEKLKNGTTLINIYGLTYGSCGMVSDNCLCPRQFVLTMGETPIITQHTSRTYRFSEPALKTDLRVFTNTIAYSSRCQAADSSLDQITEISWVTATGPSKRSTVRMGYLTDVKFFKLGNSIYIVLSFFYNGNTTADHYPTVVVFELDTEISQLIQVDEIVVRGAVVMDVVWAAPSYVLVIGNIKPEKGSIESVKTEIYRFNEKINKFQFVKRLRSNGVTSLRAMRIENQPFIFITQKSPWPLIAYKYQQEQDDFIFSEKLHHHVGFLSVSPINLASGDNYVGVVFMNNRFSILNYKQIEGLVEESSIKQDFVNSLQNYEITGKQYILAVSSAGESVIYNLVI